MKKQLASASEIFKKIVTKYPKGDQAKKAQQKYKIQSTPTIYINEKKYEDKHEYKQFKKAIEKLL